MFRRDYQIRIRISKDGTEFEAQGDKTFVQKVFTEFKGIEPLTMEDKTKESSEHGEPEKEKEEKSYLSVSDWVTYLTGEKFGIMGTVLNVAALLVALVALIYLVETPHALGEAISTGVLVISLTVYLFMTTFKPLERTGKKAQDLLKVVMTGKLSEECIRKEWFKEPKPKK